MFTTAYSWADLAVLAFTDALALVWRTATPCPVRFLDGFFELGLGHIVANWEMCLDVLAEWDRAYLVHMLQGLLAIDVVLWDLRLVVAYMGAVCEWMESVHR